MPYNRAIVSGNALEIYEYEKDIPLYRTKRKRSKTVADVPSVVSTGENILSERELGRRRSSSGRASLAFRRLVSANLVGTDRPLLFALTYAENFTDLRGAYKDFTAFIQALRYRFGSEFKYVAVPEFQKRGAVHFHALFWGLPSELVLSERQTRAIAKLWGHGFVDLVQTDGNVKISGYLSKYMAKAFIDSRLSGCKAYVASRNILRPLVQSFSGNLWAFLREWGVDKPAILNREFMTLWLGRCQYKYYLLD